MKRYALKLIAIFAFSYIAFSVIIVLFYTNIASRYVFERAGDNIEDVNEAMAERINQSLLLDIDRLETLIGDIDDEEDDVSAAISAEYLARGIGVSHVATLEEGAGLEFAETFYDFDERFDPKNAEHRVSFYSRSEALGTDFEETELLVIRSGDLLVMLDAYAYFESLMELPDIERVSYFIIVKDHQIMLQENQETTDDKFFDLLRTSNVNEVHIENMIEALYDRETYTTNTSFGDQDVFMSFAPLLAAFSDRDLYLVQAFETDSALSVFDDIDNLLWAVFALTLIVLLASLYLVYVLVSSKQNDIELPRLIHYYQKPYLIRIDRKGTIKWVNRTFKEHIPSYKSYKSILDFDVQHVEKQDLIEHIRRQHSLTTVFNFYEQDHYIHFITLKSFGGFTLIGDDVSEIEGKYDTLRQLALIDPITELPNKNHLLGDLNEHLRDSPSVGSDALVIFEVVSLERFKRMLSESVVKETLNLLISTLNKSLESFTADIYHTSFNRFTIFFKNLEDKDQAIEWSKDLMWVLRDPLTVSKNILEIELKFGLFYIEPDKYTSLNEHKCLAHADLALEHAKESATSTLIVYDVNLTQYTSREEVMEEDLVKAIRNNEFMMFFQPQFNHSKQRIVGFEALIRWDHPRYINESPLQFIKLAEKNNMIIDIGKIALNETFRLAKEFEPFDVQISINVSPVQVMQIGFVSDMIDLLKSYDLKKNMISIEITETFLMTSFQEIIDKLKTLQSHGFNIHLDDFGTGYSSLQYLRDLPINTIKVDRAFIDYITTDRYSRAIVQMVANLAKNVGLDVIAEGVEQQKQYQLLVKNGFNIFQGYYFSPPVDKKDALELIRVYNIDRTKTFDPISKPKK
ncbi:MAG: putative bifunctional diguanylate cyclase/phosphodiesterase [Acholeplasmataceae bacterium]